MVIAKMFREDDRDRSSRFDPIVVMVAEESVPDSESDGMHPSLVF